MIIESLIALSIVCVALISLVPMMVSATRTATFNEQRTKAYSIATKKIEAIKSLAYESVGVQGAYPPGVLQRDEAVPSDNITFNVQTVVSWVDNPDDGISPTDPDGRDYKQVTVTVSWTSEFGPGSVKATTNITRESDEQLIFGGNIKVIVKTLGGQVVEGAKVDILQGPGSPMTGYTDGDGKLIFYALVESVTEKDYAITVSKAGYVCQPKLAVQHATSKSGQMDVLEFIISQPGQLTVRLVDQAGTLITTDSTITITGSEATGTSVYHQINNGCYQIDNVFPGGWQIAPTARLYLAPSQPASVQVDAGKTTSVNITMLPPAQGRLHLTVRDATTLVGIGSATAILTGISATDTANMTTNVQGTADVTITAGTYRLQVSKASYTGFDQQITIDSSGTTNYTVDLAPVPQYGTLALTVRNSQTSALIGGAQATLTGPTPANATTDANGTANMSVQVGTYTLTVTKSGYTDYSQQVTIVAGANSLTVNLVPTATQNGTFALTVRNWYTRSTVSSAQVTLAGLSSASGTTNLSGQASFTVPAGTYTLTVTKSGYTDYSQQVTIVAGANSLTVYIVPFGSLKVYASANTKIRVTGPGYSRDQTVGWDWTVTFSNLSAATTGTIYTVRRYRNGSWTDSKTITINPGQQGSVDYTGWH
ncbi:MAG TPA: carboxypeptidase regulatory-like domain-containing protein [Candidatus Aquicultor sp.]